MALTVASISTVMYSRFEAYDVHKSILFTTTNTGTFNANEKPKCSLVVPAIPFFALIKSMANSGE